MNALRSFFLNNIGLKLIALVLAFLLWLTFAVPEPVQRTLSLPIEFVNMSSQLEIADDYDKQVEVVIRSQRSSSTFEERSLAVVIDLKAASSGTEMIPLTEANIRDRPSGVEVLSLTPARIQLKLEKTMSKIVEVTPELVGIPAEDYEVTGTQSTPGTVMISGPESRVRMVTTAKTEPLNVEGLSATVFQNAYLDLEDSRLRIENIASVNVVVTIDEKRREVRITRVPVQVLPEADPAKVLTRRVEIVGSIPLSFAGELKPENFQVIVSVAELEARREPYELTPQVTVAEEFSGTFELTSVDPELVRVSKPQ